MWNTLLNMRRMTALLCIRRFMVHISNQSSLILKGEWNTWSLLLFTVTFWLFYEDFFFYFLFWLCFLFSPRRIRIPIKYCHPWLAFSTAATAALSTLPLRVQPFLDRRSCHSTWLGDRKHSTWWLTCLALGRSFQNRLLGLGMLQRSIFLFHLLVAVHQP